MFSSLDKRKVQDTAQLKLLGRGLLGVGVCFRRPLSTQGSPGGLCPLRGAPGRQGLCFDDFTPRAQKSPLPPPLPPAHRPTPTWSHPNTCCQPIMTLPAISPLSPQYLPLGKTQQKHGIRVIPYFPRGCQPHPATSPCICPDVGRGGYRCEGSLGLPSEGEMTERR